MGDTSLLYASAPPAHTAATEGQPRRAAGEPLDELIAEVQRRSPHPIDMLEVAAVLESIGVVDEVAARRFATPDSFALAELVLRRIRQAARPYTPPTAADPPAPSWREALGDYVRGLSSVLAIVILLLIIMAYSRFGMWSERQVMALSMGISGSMVVTNGFIQAMSRRGAIYLSRRNPLAARRFLLLAALPTAITTVVAGAATAGALQLLAGYTPDETLIFLGAYTALAIIWFLAAVLALVERALWLSISLAAGLLVGSGVELLATLLAPGPHLLLSGAAGLSVSLAIILAVARRGLAISAGQAEARTTLPSAGYLIAEGGPYFIYGLAYTLFIFSPHLLGGFGALPEGVGRSTALSTFEIGMTIALQPLLLASGVLEHSGRQFWGVARRALLDSPPIEPERFGRQLARFVGAQLRRYSATLIITSLLTMAALGLALQSGLVTRIWPIPDPTALWVVILGGVVSYALLGIGLFFCMLCVMLGRPDLVLGGIGAGFAAQLILGAPLALGTDYRYALLAFLAGALAFLFGAALGVRQLLRELDYFYYTSF